jgi:hypothetical protein
MSHGEYEVSVSPREASVSHWEVGRDATVRNYERRYA